MSGITLIVGSLIGEETHNKIDLNELYYEHWYPNQDNENLLDIHRERFPISHIARRYVEINQYLGSGKTLYGMQLLAERVFFGDAVEGNLCLIWQNEGKPKSEWECHINSLDDLDKLNNCTVMLDDIIGTIDNWNAKPALIVTKIAVAARKVGLDIIITAQRDIHIPPNIRKIATEWIVPVIRVRDFSRPTPDRDMGYPIEMVALHFDGTKIFKYMTPPIIHLEKLFDCYSTVQIAQGLKGEVNQDRIKKVSSPKRLHANINA
jgi:hypothetical protein